MASLSFAKLNRAEADKVNTIFQNILQNKVNRKIIIIKENEINSYLYFYRNRIFEDDVKWVKTKFKNGYIRLRIVMFLNKALNNSYLELLKGSIVDINTDFKILNIKRNCFKIKLLSLNINNFSLNEKFTLSLISSIAPEFKVYFEGFCPHYKIKKIRVREKRLILLF